MSIAAPYSLLFAARPCIYPSQNTASANLCEQMKFQGSSHTVGDEADQEGRFVGVVIRVGLLLVQDLAPCGPLTPQCLHPETTRWPFYPFSKS